MEKELRKHQNHLVDAGLGVILFAVWTVVRVNLYLGFVTIPMDDLYKVSEEIGIDGKYFLIFLLVVLAAVLLWQLVIRLYIGLSANAEGKGKKKSWLYLAIAAMLLLAELQTSWQAFGVERIMAGEEVSMEMVMAICMEAASMYVLLELLISGVRVKLLRKKMEE